MNVSNAIKDTSIATKESSPTETSKETSTTETSKETSPTETSKETSTTETNKESSPSKETIPTETNKETIPTETSPSKESSLIESSKETIPTETSPTTPTEVNLVKQFLQKVRKGDLTDVAKSVSEPDEMTIFAQIKKKIKDGDFSDIVKSLPSPPPFPTALVMQIAMSLNDIFQQNIGKIGKAVGDTIDIEIEKKKNELALTKALGEQATKTELESHMKSYIEHEFTK